MAIFRLRFSDGNDADDGSTWSLAKKTLVGALAACSPGDIIWVSHTHAETQASAMALTSPGTAAAPVWILCVNDGSDPASSLATTATVTTTGSSRITFEGFALVYGHIFTGATSGTQGAISAGIGVSPVGWVFRNCELAVGAGYTSAAAMTFGNGANSTDDQYFGLIDTVLRFSHANQTLRLFGGVFRKWGGSVAGTVPTTLIATATAAGNSHSFFQGVDFSEIGSGKTLVALGGSHATVRMRNCKLHSSVSITTGTVSGPGSTIVSLASCEPAGLGDFYIDYAGAIAGELTVLRTGGAAVSRKMISSAQCNQSYPLVMGDLLLRNTTVGSSVTVTVHIVTDNVTLTDQQCWLEVEYLGTSGSSLSSFSDDGDSLSDRLLAGSASDQPSSSETWASVPGTPVKQQLSVSVTPQQTGPIRCRVVLAKASTTVYVCPKVECSSVTEGASYQADTALYVIEPAGGGLLVHPGMTGGMRG